MTNQELLETNMVDSDKSLYDTALFAMDLARKDEREKVIGEIERICQPSKPTCESNLGMESFKKIILATLNSLKQ